MRSDFSHKREIDWNAGSDLVYGFLIISPIYCQGSSINLGWFREQDLMAEVAFNWHVEYDFEMNSGEICSNLLKIMKY